MKDKKNKLKWRLLNLKAFEGIVRVREYGVSKYPNGGTENWREQSVNDYMDAATRHLIAMYDKGYNAIDDESGLSHLWLLACNVYFLCVFLREGKKQNA